MDTIARRLRMDPLDFRRRNAMQAGDAAHSGDVIRSCGFAEALDAATREVNWGAIGGGGPPPRGRQRPGGGGPGPPAPPPPPPDLGSVASRVTHIGGNAVRRAVAKAKGFLLRKAAQMIEAAE